MNLVIIPLPDLRDGCVEAPEVFIQQVVTKVSAKLIEGFGDFALRFRRQIFPDGAAGQTDFGWNRIVGVNRIA